MVDLNKYLKRFKEKANLSDFPDEYIFNDKFMCKEFCIWLNYELKNRYYYYSED